MIHHVEINVSNLQKTTDFWGWLLGEFGYAVFQQWEHGISWKFGETYIVFVQTEQPYLDIAYHRKATGLNHLAFRARSRDQVDEICAQLAARGHPILYGDRHPYAGGEGHYAVFFEDPDRIKVEVAYDE
jgi:catechol 2,3-dioxygenase-like lactoylglutathione lyase family enzyme